MDKIEINDKWIQVIIHEVNTCIIDNTLVYSLPVDSLQDVLQNLNKLSGGKREEKEMNIEIIGENKEIVKAVEKKSTKK